MSRRALLIVTALSTPVVSLPVAEAQSDSRVRPASAQQVAGADERQAALPRTARPQPQPMRLSEEMEKLLQDWEAQSSRVRSLTGDHKRYIYDYVAQIEKRAQGTFWYEAPDKGAIKILADETGKGQTNKAKSDPQGRPANLTIQPDSSQMWVCDGEQVLTLDPEQKGYYRSVIPPQLRGDNIMNSPLPFLFGMKAADMKTRYRLQLGKLHNPSGGVVHVVAFPTRPVDAQNWSKADVLLDATYFMPKAIKLLNPGGNSETVYYFDQRSLKANQKFGSFLKGSPFKPSLRGYKLLQEQGAEAGQ